MFLFLYCPSVRLHKTHTDKLVQMRYMSCKLLLLCCHVNMLLNYFLFAIVVHVVYQLKPHSSGQPLNAVNAGLSWSAFSFHLISVGSIFMHIINVFVV